MGLSLRQILLFVTVVAIAWAQTVGIHRGYLCECGGTPQVTMADHCHGPHSDSCHEQEVCDHDHHSAPRHGPPSDDKQDHPAVKESLIARHEQGVTMCVHLPSGNELECLWIAGDHISVRNGEVGLQLADTWYRSDGLIRDGWPQRLAHTIALRI